LNYFNLPGRAEICRMILHHANVEYVDNRIPSSEWGAIKTGDPKFRGLSLPQLQVGEKMYTEHLTIARYLCDKLGYLPQDIDERTECEELVDVTRYKFTEIAPLIYFIPEGEERNQQATALIETCVRPILKFVEDRFEKRENNNYYVGSSLSFADFCLYNLYIMPFRERLPHIYGSVLIEYPLTKRYFDLLKDKEFKEYTRQIHDKQHSIPEEDRAAVNKILDFWFPVEFITQKMTPDLMKIWFMGGEEVDAKCREFEPWMEKAKNGDLDHWTKEPTARLALVLLCDQFSRNIYRKQAKAFDFDSKASQVVKDSLKQGHFYQYSHLELLFFILPLTHSESKEDQVLAVEYN
jgi:uncharacterized protein (DUF924 family)/glutathione S-transferase